jgi:hypothetical protein
MSRLRIQTFPGIPEIPRTNEPQNTEVKAPTQELSSPAQQNKESQQAKEVAKSRLGEIRTAVTAQFNPKEISIDRSSSISNEVDTTSKKNSAILYNGHAGLGENS